MGDRGSGLMKVWSSQTCSITTGLNHGDCSVIVHAVRAHSVRVNKRTWYTSHVSQYTLILWEYTVTEVGELQAWNILNRSVLYASQIFASPGHDCEAWTPIQSWLKLRSNMCLRKKIDIYIWLTTLCNYAICVLNGCRTIWLKYTVGTDDAGFADSLSKCVSV